MKVASLLDGARERGPFEGEGGRTSSSFERAVLADGTPVVIKHASPDGLVARMVGGTDELYRLWTGGVFERIPAEIDHTILAVEADGGGWLVIMRDQSESLFGETRVLTRAENCRVLHAVDAMHQEFWAQRPDGALSIHQFFAAFLSLERLTTFKDQWPIVKLFRRGWDLFPDVAPPDVVEPIFSILRDPAPLADELGRCDSTLIHGDLRLHNLGLTADQVVLLDWELASYGPPALEFAWYLIISASRIDATREQITDDFRSIAGDRFDPRALELAMIAAVGQLGWNKALDIMENPDPAIRAQERADLDWWIARVRRAFEVWSPV